MARPYMPRKGPPIPPDPPHPPRGGRGGGGPPPRTPAPGHPAALPPHHPAAGGKAPLRCAARRKAGVGTVQYAANVIQTESNAIGSTDGCWGGGGPPPRTPPTSPPGGRGGGGLPPRTPPPRHPAAPPPRRPADCRKTPSRCAARRSPVVWTDDLALRCSPKLSAVPTFRRVYHVPLL